jgi:hypothetical protein
MATIAVRPWTLPTRDRLRGLSRWVWVLLALAGLVAIVRILTATTDTVDSILSAARAASPLIAAAALMAVAPAQRLVALSAFGFAAGPTLRTLQAMFSADMHDLLRMSLPAYLDLAGGVQAVVGTFRGINWLFELVAVLGLAFYLGTVRSQRGWWIVGIGIVLAAVHVVANVLTLWPILSSMGEFPDVGFEPAQQLASTVLGSLGLIAWAYLWAVAVDRRLYLIGLAGGVWLIQSAIGLLSFAAIQAFPPDLSAANVDTFNLASFWIATLFDVVFWGLLILGILRELPREKIRPTDTPAPAEAEVTAG